MIRTGPEYKDSIRGNRDVYINGEKVADVTAHPMFKPLVDIRARIYDMQHEAATRDIMTFTDKGETHSIGSKLPYSQEDWWAKRRATDAVLNDVKGVVTRVGDETVGEMWSLFDGKDILNKVDPQFAQNIERHIRQVLHDSDYAGHRLTFQLFAQSPPFAHLAAIYRNFDWDGPLSFVKDAANLSDNVTGKATMARADSAVSRWFSMEVPKANTEKAAA